jgi:hypothetical protein
MRICEQVTSAVIPHCCCSPADDMHATRTAFWTVRVSIRLHHNTILHTLFKQLAYACQCDQQCITPPLLHPRCPFNTSLAHLACRLHLLA